MAEKKRKNQEEKSAPRALNYEDVLNSFVRDEGKDTKSTGASRTDLDGLALAELLGEEVPDTPAIGAASGHYDAIGASDYSELARQFEELDLSELTAEDVEEDAAQDIAPAKSEVAGDLTDFPADLKLDDEDLSPEDTAGYAALLDQLEAEGKPESTRSAVSEKTDFTALPAGEQMESDSLDWELLLEPEPGKSGKSGEPSDAPVRTEVLSFVNLAESMDASPAGPVIEEIAAMPAPDSPVAESDALDLSDLFASETEAVGVQAGEPAILPGRIPEAAPVDTAVTGVDFLGLTALAPRENRAAEKPVRRMEVLFEGVEMNFEDQTDEVTLAELLLAQGKKKEAADLFQRVSRNKGTTFWVAKRLRSFAANAEN